MVAVHPAGSAGAVTPSKFSTHGGAGVGEAVGTGVGVGVVGPGVGVGVVGPGVGVGVVGPGVGVGVVGPGVAVGPGVGPGAALRSYTSMIPMPVVLFSPAIKAV